MASYAELTIDQGTSYTGVITLANDDGSPMDITGSDFLCQIRKSYYSMNATAEIVMTIEDAAAGRVRLSMAPEISANVKPGRYLYDIKRTDQYGANTRLVEGIVTITPQVSK